MAISPPARDEDGLPAAAAPPAAGTDASPASVPRRPVASGGPPAAARAPREPVKSAPEPDSAVNWDRLLRARMGRLSFGLSPPGLLLVYLGRTPWRRNLRAVRENEEAAAASGVNVISYKLQALALGSGIAGLAGCALSQIGNVGPDLGQNYIVDSFMVVVLGGVGQIAGTVYAALGLGIVNKFLEGWTGAVLAKIFVLVIVVVFIQKRPQGLFAMKGRSAEA